MSIRHTFEGFDGRTNSKLVAQNGSVILALALLVWQAVAPVFGVPAAALAFVPETVEHLMMIAFGAAGVFQWESRAHTRTPKRTEEVTR